MNHETIVGLPAGHTTVGVDRSKSSRPEARPTIAPEPARRTRRPPAGAKAPIEPSPDATADVAHFDDLILPKHHLLREMHRERRRADRSKSPLSVVIFRSEGEQHDQLDRAERLLEILRNAKRETDVLGDLGDCASR